MRTISLLVFAVITALAGNASAQDCVDCRTSYVIPWRSSPVVKTWTETEMVKTKQLRTVEVEVEIPVVRTYETREITYAAPAKPRKAVNWGCVAAGVQAFINCNYQKRQARRQARAASGRLGLFSRLFFWRR